jgi:hypothetical protein
VSTLEQILVQLQHWLSEEGKPTGARFVRNIEYDCNWSDAFHVVLVEWVDGFPREFTGGGPNTKSGLETALNDALSKAEVRA